MTGRTVNKWIRAYIDGYDLSGYGRSVGPLEIVHDEVDFTVWTDQVKGYEKGHTHVNIGTFNGVYDTTVTTGIDAVMQTADQLRDVLVAYGMRAAPVDGDPAFMGQFRQSAYKVTNSGGAVMVEIPFAGWDGSPTSRNYPGGWGLLLHAKAAETQPAVNTDLGFDNPWAAATANGGYLMYHLLSSDGTITLKVQDAAANNVDGDYADLAGATSGAITAAVTPQSGIVASTTSTVRRYSRAQWVWGTATTATFVIGFFRK